MNPIAPAAEEASPSSPHAHAVTSTASSTAAALEVASISPDGSGGGGGLGLASLPAPLLGLALHMLPFFDRHLRAPFVNARFAAVLGYKISSARCNGNHNGNGGSTDSGEGQPLQRRRRRRQQRRSSSNDESCEKVPSSAYFSGADADIHGNNADNVCDSSDDDGDGVDSSAPSVAAAAAAAPRDILCVRPLRHERVDFACGLDAVRRTITFPIGRMRDAFVAQQTASGTHGLLSLTSLWH
jgi:hypothetical protein